MVGLTCHLELLPHIHNESSSKGLILQQCLDNAGAVYYRQLVEMTVTLLWKDFTPYLYHGFSSIASTCIHMLSLVYLMRLFPLILVPGILAPGILRLSLY